MDVKKPFDLCLSMSSEGEKDFTLTFKLGDLSGVFLLIRIFTAHIEVIHNMTSNNDYRESFSAVLEKELLDEENLQKCFKVEYLVNLLDTSASMYLSVQKNSKWEKVKEIHYGIPYTCDFSPLLKRMQHATATDSNSGLAYWLGIEESQLTHNIDNFFMPIQWLEKISSKTRISFDWLMTGRFDEVDKLFKNGSYPFYAQGQEVEYKKILTDIDIKSAPLSTGKELHFWTEKWQK